MLIDPKNKQVVRPHPKAKQHELAPLREVLVPTRRKGDRMFRLGERARLAPAAEVPAG